MGLIPRIENLDFTKAHDVKIVSIHERKLAEDNYVLQMTLKCGLNLKIWRLV